MTKSKKKSLGWKQSNYRKIPSSILAKIGCMKTRHIVVACTKIISESDIAQNKYVHIGITIHNGLISFPQSIIPKPDVGSFSKTNLQGKEIARKDLPKATKIISIECPNFGDWSKGSHTIDFSREVYEKDVIKPKELELKVELLREEIRGRERCFLFKFTIGIVLNQQDFNFKTDLLYCLNLLQENVGAANVFSNNAAPEEYLKTITVDWEILPVGNKEMVLAKMLKSFKFPSKEVHDKLLQRYNLLMKLKPTAFISGTNGFRRYFGAKFDNNLVVFENLEYGNAIYVMFEQWEILSKKTRLELLACEEKGFERIIHKSGWEDKLRIVVKRGSLISK